MLKALFIETSKFEFYNTNTEWKELSTSFTVKFTPSSSNTQIIPYVENVIKFIRNNNAATLIGSIQSTENLYNFVFASKGIICSYNSELNKNLLDIRGSQLNTGINEEDDVFEINTRLKIIN